MGRYHCAAYLADITPRGFIAPSASLSHRNLVLQEHVFIGDGTVISQATEDGVVDIGRSVHLYGSSFIETGSGGGVSIGDNTHIQPGCHIHSHVSSIRIGEQVEIAANCGFYSYSHGVKAGIPIIEQPIASDGGIVIGSGVWIGFGVVVLQNVVIGEGAVIGAGSVVSRDIPPNAIAVGVPARVIRFRE